MREHKRALIISLVLCCLAAVLLVGLIRFSGDREKELLTLMDMEDGQGPRDMDDPEKEIPAATESSQSQAVSGGNVSLQEETEAPKAEVTQAPAAVQEKTTAKETAADEGGNTTAGGKEAVANTGSDGAIMYEDNATSALRFTDSSKLVWPVQGNVLMEYSMDIPVYFATLDQYKRNSGLLIQSQEDTPVYAGADGVITSVEESDRLGWTVTMDLGNDYSVTYSQLKDVAVETGAHVAAGAVLGKVASPARCYSVEGDSVYMEMRKGDATVDPLDYLE